MAHYVALMAIGLKPIVKTGCHSEGAPATEESEQRGMKQYYVYIMASRSKTLYAGITDDLHRRVYEHKNKLIEGFTKRYNVTQLVHYEVTGDVQAAIQREKQIKGWLRRKKVALIEAMNPEWADLSEGWLQEQHSSGCPKGREILRFAQNDIVKGSQ